MFSPLHSTSLIMIVSPSIGIPCTQCILTYSLWCVTVRRQQDEPFSLADLLLDAPAPTTQIAIGFLIERLQKKMKLRQAATLTRCQHGHNTVAKRV